MTRYLVRRILWFIPLLFTITLLTFVLMRAIPGGPFDYEGDRALPPEIVANLEAKYHLDWPMWKQFASYLVGDELVDRAAYRKALALNQNPSRGIIRGDLGPSFRYRSQTVNDIVRTTFPVSAQMGIMAILLALVIGIPAGTIAALKQNSAIDYLSTLAAVFFASVPNLVLSPILILVFAIKLGWLPTALWVSKPPFFLGFLPQPSDIGLDYFKHAILPVFALGTFYAAGIARLTRASLLQVVSQDFIRTARAKGLKERVVIFRHVFKSSMIPVVTIIGPMVAGVLTGTFVVEQIFGINGMGKHFVTSIGNRDYTVIMGLTLIYSFLVMASNLLVDITYAWLDPRIHYD
ncbi:MAG: ABC transporter permease [Anaerolineales bacterium]|nr:ABC transporter permease [Anaerolineales bacterium]